MSTRCYACHSSKLAASPQYGECWVRYWLDAVRYAEDNPGNITNPPYPH